jgi:hypothetical protein
MNIFYDDLVKHPFFQTFWSNDDIIVWHRHTDDDFYELHGLSPYSTIPYFIIYGEGITPNTEF